MPNRLGTQKSPYLLQHADNPVDWYPWGTEALERAKAEDRPILVSIGYSACHWCHVMAHESFEDDATAALMNERFVNIKVDREERPDVDAIYMEAVQAMTRAGGWPLNVFLSPDGRPFYGGTYYPPEPRHGMPSWRQVLESVATAYKERREDVIHNADALTRYLSESQQRNTSGPLDSDLLVAAYQHTAGEMDWEEGGFGGAPKFPQPLAIGFLLRMWRRLNDPRALEFVNRTLHKMAEGGIFDHVGGGFHRYTVDGNWIVPHFEKMLYDNAQLAYVYTLAWQATHDPLYRRTAELTLDFILRDMRAPEGGFYSAFDADSEGEEGKFYVWTLAEIEGVLGADAAIVALRYGVREHGNFEGTTILTISRSVDEIAHETRLSSDDIRQRLEAARKALFRVRSERVYPGMDTKIVASWNALTIRALAEAGRAFDRSDYLDAAEKAADFVLGSMTPGSGLVRSYREGPSHVRAFLEDYAYLLEGLVCLYETTFLSRRLDQARRVADEMIDRFGDPETGVFFDTQSADGLIVRPRGRFDNPIPAGNSSAAMGLLRLSAITGELHYESAALPSLRSVSDIAPRAPLALSYLLCALDFHLSAAVQVAIISRDEREAHDMVQRVFDRYLPNRVIAVGEPDETPLLRNRARVGGRPTAYVCENFACRLPVTDPDMLGAQLDERSTPGS